MRSPVAAVHDLVAAIQPVDDTEAGHRADTLRWLRRTDDVYRRVKPATPERHLVSYVVPVEPDDGAVLLVAHRNAGLWLPPGGHVERDEHPALTAGREAAEELGLDSAVEQGPLFLTVTRTVGVDAGHTDVSLWFPLAVRRGERLSHDGSEFDRIRWWTPDEIRTADPALLDPHLGRFVDKCAASS